MYYTKGQLKTKTIFSDIFKKNIKYKNKLWIYSLEKKQQQQTYKGEHIVMKLFSCMKKKTKTKQNWKNKNKYY